MSSLFDLPFDDRSLTGAAPMRANAATVLTVSELTSHIRDILENAYAEVWVEANSPTAGCGTPGTCTSR